MAIRRQTLACAAGVGLVMVQAAGVSHAASLPIPADPGQASQAIEQGPPQLIKLAEGGKGQPAGHGSLIGLFGNATSDGAVAGGDGTVLYVLQGGHAQGPGSGGNAVPIG